MLVKQILLLIYKSSVSISIDVLKYRQETSSSACIKSHREFNMTTTFQKKNIKITKYC